MPLEHLADSVLPTASALRRTGKLITRRSEEGEATPDAGLVLPAVRVLQESNT